MTHYSIEQFAALCAFNGVSPSEAPIGWRPAPNEWCVAPWDRVIEAANKGGDASDLFHTFRNHLPGHRTIEPATLSAYDRVRKALSEF